jgi:hypothetical protein
MQERVPEIQWGKTGRLGQPVCIDLDDAVPVGNGPEIGFDRKEQPKVVSFSLNIVAYPR